MLALLKTLVDDKGAWAKLATEDGIQKVPFFNVGKPCNCYGCETRLILLRDYPIIEPFRSSHFFGNFDV